MNITLKDIWSKYHENYLMQPMTVWLGNESCVASGIRAFTIDNHLGIDKVREMVGPEFKVYAVRESDELNCEPATLENHEVMVNFFCYLIVDEDLDWAFKSQDYIPFYDWTYDWDGEPYWED